MAPERLLGTRPRDSELPEPRRNRLLRLVDWRFLLDGPERPRVIDLTPGWDSEALRLVSGPAGPGEADLALVGFPTAAVLRSARDALAPGGAVVCRWRLPRLAGAQRARRRLRRAGFEAPRLYWAGPVPHRPPQFWLPLDSAPAAGHVLDSRPARSSAGVGLRRLWRTAERLGLLAPLYAVARAPGGEGAGAAEPLLLLTGGHRSINKVVALDFDPETGRPRGARKIARVEEAEPGLRREADVLEWLAGEALAGEGFPAPRGRGRRGGRLAVAESVIEGDPMLDRLTPLSFEEMARRVTDLLVELAARRREPESGWRQRSIELPLADFQAAFGAVVSAADRARLRAALGEIAELPRVCEHRDCSPWNLVLAARDRPALLDWESAEPDGLPLLDLVYFLANAAFVLDGALEAGTTRQSYARLLDPATAHGRVAAEAIERYRQALRLDPADVPRLRLLCWLVHCRSDYRHLRLEVAGEPSERALRGAPFLGLVEEELGRLP
ncbi:MAG TPA: hypothetical protein VHI77_07380 [Solirubrobacterales bacterium]|jgi:hypothetical protein|nr:hypothetical protein [Solirubrobacterales bacterium]